MLLEIGTFWLGKIVESISNCLLRAVSDSTRLGCLEQQGSLGL